MLCGETVAVCCENRTEHTDTLWTVRTSQETRYFSATELNRLMMCGETVAVRCENRLCREGGGSERYYGGGEENLTSVLKTMKSAVF
jgi:hypothetical protein